jgi:probable phosphoglycerate mutase
MLGGLAVAQIQADDIHPSGHDLCENMVGSRPEGGHDLGTAIHACLSSRYMNLLLIRHALPVRREGATGPADPELSEIGMRQAKRLAEYLAAEDLDAVYSSPLRRAVETAAPVASAHRIDAVEIEGVAEWDRHAPEYIPVEELKAANDPRWQALVAGTWEGDEDPAEFHQRVRSSIDELVLRHRGEQIAVVCHGGVINSYLAQILGLDLIGNGFFYPNYTSIHRVAASSGGARSLVTLNETAHLRGTGLPMGLLQ